jgi:very-short-patch-repair endonuclease
MLIQTVRSILELHPAGLSHDQLLWRLRSSGLRYSADDILQSLDALIGNGELVRTRSGRWQVAAFRARPPDQDPSVVRPGSGATGLTVTLQAVPASIVKSVAEPEETFEPTQGVRADADLKALLRYYAATQRQDPRGRVDEKLDQHARSWQLFRADGPWWAPGSLQISLEALPHEFREALMRREALRQGDQSVCSIGYPVSLFDQAGVPSFLPALLLPASYQVGPSHLVVEILAADPVINPLWLEIAVKRSQWQKENLVEALMPDGETGDLGEIVNRLRNSMAKLGGALLRPAQLAGELTVSSDGLRNAAGLFLSTDARFTGGAERDLDGMQGWSDAIIRETALGHLFAAGRGDAGEDLPPAGPLVLTERQHAAAVSSLRGPLTLIQGPPGTGKSAVILSLLTSIVLAGRSVLLASKNHQALDEVEERLAKLVDGAPILTRGRDSEGERDTNFFAQMRELADSETQAEGSGEPALIAAALNRARQLHGLFKASAEKHRINIALSEAIERLDAWNATTPAEAVQRVPWWQSVMRRIRALFTRRAESAAETLDSLAQQIGQLRRELATLPAMPAPTDWDCLADMLAADVKAALRAVAAFRTTPTRAEALLLADRLKELEFNSRTRRPALTAEDARLVLRHRPVWALSTLSVGSRVPLVAGLFDYVIFDEASQCDIASALPLLGRARHAVIVGDPMQLQFIPQLSLPQEHALMDAAGVGRLGRHSIAQSKNSLFAFIRQRQAARWHFLANQFRSDPAIVSYINQEFYDGRLVASQDPRGVRIPLGFRPGLAWHDVQGRATREESGSINIAEADAIVQVLTRMIRDGKFTGSIGVLSPFNAQVALLLRRIGAALTEKERHQVQLRVSTIDKFQGGEADVILFSLVVAEGVHSATLGFLGRERRRVNVAISRARALCLVFGDKAYALRSEIGLLARLASITSDPAKPRHDFDSEWERRLFEAMRRRGLQPIPQYPVIGRYLDFALDPDGRRLDVEVDGRRWHADPDGNRKLSDRLRDRALIALGWKVRRFWVHELSDNMENCLDLIERDLAGG